MKRTPLTIFILAFMLPQAALFTQEQRIWLDYNPRHRFNTETQYSGTFEIDKSLSQGGWTRYQLQTSLNHYLAGWISVHGALDLFYTMDPDLENVFEIRPWVKGTLYWQTYAEYLNLYFPYLGIRLEQRFLKYADIDGLESKTRLRFSAGSKFTLNNDIIDDDTWYLHFRVELFYNINEAATERYADQNRVMAGVGYNLNRKLRGEFRYTLQNSENTIGARDENSTHIFQLIFTQFF